MMTACGNAGTLASVATAVMTAKAAFTANVGKACPFSVFITIPGVARRSKHAPLEYLNAGSRKTRRAIFRFFRVGRNATLRA